jgi:alpha-N-arabinofuranosidase
MNAAGQYLDGISLHYYTLPTGTWGQNKGDATNFPESQWSSTMTRAKHMDELITKHSTIMDHYDPEKKVNLIVDEWGTWYNVEKGTNPGFLHQQNTIRDAMVAAINLNIFHKHADRVYMANIAQMVNVLQAMILTKGDQMLKTPTYYVFDMYQKHMDAELLEGIGQVPDNVTYTASRKNGTVTISICNYDAHENQVITFNGLKTLKTIDSAQILTADKLDAHNTFENPNAVSEATFTGAKFDHGELQLALPSKSVVSITLK